MFTRRSFLLGSAIASVVGVAGGAYTAYRRGLQSAEDAIRPALSHLAKTRHGPVEFADIGRGPGVLMLHGTGGGFDQGLLMAAPLVDMGYRVIAPSRFGYLRTPMPVGADHWTEAEVLCDLLDRLGLDRVAVAGVSAGAIPALAFALRYPDRCAALLPIVPAFFLPGRAPVAPWSPWRERVVRAILQSDFLFWAAMTLAPGRIIGSVLATDPALVDAAEPVEAARVRLVMHSLLPISRRAQGIMFDGIQANRDLELDLTAIRSPTLAVSCEDDRYRTAENARFIAATTPGAQALVFPEGGHVWVGHDAELFAAVDAFLKPLTAA